MTDQVWQAVRYVLIAAGSFLAGFGKVPAADVAPIVDEVMQIAGGAVALASAAWGLYVRLRTVAVPVKVAEQKAVPVVSSATGAVLR